MRATEFITEIEGSVRDYHLADWVQNTGLDEEQIHLYGQTGSNQRGGPEIAMVQAQHVLGGGVLNFVIEHAGDLTNRASPMHSFAFSFESTTEKVEKVLRTLKQGYGFRREFEENMESAASARGIQLKDHITKVEAALKKYANEHRKLRVFNQLHFMQREACIALGEFRFEDATEILESVQRMCKNREAYTSVLQKFRRDLP